MMETEIGGGGEEGDSVTNFMSEYGSIIENARASGSNGLASSRRLTSDSRTGRMNIETVRLVNGIFRLSLFYNRNSS